MLLIKRICKTIIYKQNFFCVMVEKEILKFNEFKNKNFINL